MYTFRRVTPADVGPLNVFLYRLSDQARSMRFMTGRPCTPQFVREQVGRMLAGAAGDSITLIATDARGGPGGVVGVAELACDRASRTGEVGIVVMDDAQRKGIGSLLARQLLQAAHELGLAELHGDMYAENRAIPRLIQRLGLPFTTTIQAGEMHVVVRMPE
jgi:RimJ/RimL family protein N-acetyltransferase